MSAPFVTEIDIDKRFQLEEDLKEQGFQLTKPPHTFFQAKKEGISCTLYTSGKLVIQGSRAEEFIHFYVEPTFLGDFRFTIPEEIDLTPRIGSDESGKGDLFGPLVIASVFVEGTGFSELVKMGVKDSKKLNDESAEKIARQLEKKIVYHIVKIGPEKYNQLYSQFQNLNHLLAWAHGAAITALTEKTGCKEVLLDQFAKKELMESVVAKKGLDIHLLQRPRMEEDIVVAAASVLARAHFLRELKSLSTKWQLTLPKGASSATVSAAKQFVSMHSRDELQHVAKLHFKSLEGV